MKKKKVYNSIPDPDDSTSGLDNNCAILQYNKGRIAVESDEEEDTQEDKEEDKQESIFGEELKIEIIPMVKSLTQNDISGERT